MYRLLLVALLFLPVWGLVLPLWGQLRGLERIDGAVPEEIRREQGFEAADSAGLFGGVGGFEDESFAEVPYAVDDAVDLAYLFAVELLLMAPRGVTLALTGEPRKEETRERLRRLIEAGARRRPAGRRVSAACSW